MPFPDVPRVIFSKNPLDRVICQTRFPPILRIESEVPSLFQESIRATYPLYVKKQEFPIGSSPNIGRLFPLRLSEDLQKAMMGVAPSGNMNHEFTSEDGKWTINLTRTFVAISTTSYTRWEDFRTRFKSVFDPLNDIYRPPFFTRVGLRYIDVFNRSKLGLSDSAWKDLLQPYVLGMLSSEIDANIENYVSNCEVSLKDNESLVRIAASFAMILGNNEQVFIVDSDFHNEKKSNADLVFKKLDFMNLRAARLIQWMIKEKLYDAMEPSKI